MSQEQKYQRRLQTVKSALSQGVRQTAIRYGIPERTIHSWLKRYRERGLEGLKDRSRAPRVVWNKKDSDEVLARALKRLHEQEPGLNRFQILCRLMSEDTAQIPTLSWINRATRRLGLVRRVRRKIKAHPTRYEISEPGALQIDTKEVQTVEGERIYQFTAIDECTRVRYLRGSLTKGSKAAVKFLESALEFYDSVGVKIWRVQTDWGTEFCLPRNELTTQSYITGKTPDSRFTRACESRGIRHRKIKPRTPQLNGKVERSHRIDEQRFYSRLSFNDWVALDHALKHVWTPEYNNRPHGSLGYLTPLEKLNQVLESQSEEKIAA